MASRQFQCGPKGHACCDQSISTRAARISRKPQEVGSNITGGNHHRPEIFRAVFNPELTYCGTSMVAPATSSMAGRAAICVAAEFDPGARMGAGDATPGVVVRLVPVDN